MAPVTTRDIGVEGPAAAKTNVSKELLDRTQARGLGFSEMQVLYICVILVIKKVLWGHNKFICWSNVLLLT